VHRRKAQVRAFSTGSRPLHNELDVEGLDFAPRLDRRFVSMLRIAFKVFAR
jgi:hypothetical protein